MLETVPLNFSENVIPWLVSNISGATGALVVEVIEIKHWILGFGCASEETRDLIVNLAYWLTNPHPPPSGPPTSHS